MSGSSLLPSFFGVVHTVVRKSFLIVPFVVTIIFSSSRRERNWGDYFDIFLKDAVSRALADKNDIFIWDRQELAEMRNLSA